LLPDDPQPQQIEKFRDQLLRSRRGALMSLIYPTRCAPSSVAAAMDAVFGGDLR
jgi:hypothetical protein